MNQVFSASINLEEVLGFLKKNLQLKDVCQSILSQKVIDKAAQLRDLTVTAEEIQAEAQKIRYQKRLEKAADTLAWLAEQMITVEDWEIGIRDRLLTQKLANALFAKEVEKLFSQNRLNFDQVLLYQIILADGRLAQELFYQIQEQEISFYQAAHLYDIDERRRHQCGYEGKLDRWSLKPDLAALVFGASVGEVVGPVFTNQGYHLLMVESFMPAELTPERYQDMLNHLFREWLSYELNYMVSNQIA